MATNMIDKLELGQSIGLICFSNKVTILCELCKYSNKLSELEALINHIKKVHTYHIEDSKEIIESEYLSESETIEDNSSSIEIKEEFITEDHLESLCIIDEIGHREIRINNESTETTFRVGVFQSKDMLGTKNVTNEKCNDDSKKSLSTKKQPINCTYKPCESDLSLLPEKEPTDNMLRHIKLKKGQQQRQIQLKEQIVATNVVNNKQCKNIQEQVENRLSGKKPITHSKLYDLKNQKKINKPQIIEINSTEFYENYCKNNLKLSQIRNPQRVATTAIARMQYKNLQQTINTSSSGNQPSGENSSSSDIREKYLTEDRLRLTHCVDNMEIMKYNNESAESVERFQSKDMQDSNALEQHSANNLKETQVSLQALNNDTNEKCNNEVNQSLSTNKEQLYCPFKPCDSPLWLFSKKELKDHMLRHIVLKKSKQQQLKQQKVQWQKQHIEQSLKEKRDKQLKEQRLKLLKDFKTKLTTIVVNNKLCNIQQQEDSSFGEQTSNSICTEAQLSDIKCEKGTNIPSNIIDITSTNIYYSNCKANLKLENDRLQQGHSANESTNKSELGKLQNKKKGPIWEAEAVAILVRLWKERLPQFRDGKSNFYVYKDIARHLAKHGFKYTRTEVKTKITKLKNKYREERNISKANGFLSSCNSHRIKTFRNESSAPIMNDRPKMNSSIQSSRNDCMTPHDEISCFEDSLSLLGSANKKKRQVNPFSTSCSLIENVMKEMSAVEKEAMKLRTELMQVGRERNLILNQILSAFKD